MSQDFLMNSPWLGAPIFAFTAVLAALACYAVARRLLAAHNTGDSELLTARIIGRVGALHALILALVFTQEIADYRGVYAVVTKEASAIGDVYWGLQAYDDQESGVSASLRALVVDYVTDLLEIDQAALAEGHVSYRSWHDYQRINRLLLNLHAANDHQKDLRAQMLADWDKVSDFHRRLRTMAHNEVPHFLWLVMIAGFLAVVFPCYVYRPSLANLITLGVFAAFNGFVMYVIFSIANPFTGPAALDVYILDELLALMSSTPP